MKEKDIFCRIIDGDIPCHKLYEDLDVIAPLDDDEDDPFNVKFEDIGNSEDQLILKPPIWWFFKKGVILVFI